MKSIALTTSALFLSGTDANSVPIYSKLPGWNVATKGSDIDVKMYYDLLCPDSRDTQHMWWDLLKKDSPIKGKKYADVLSL